MPPVTRIAPTAETNAFPADAKESGEARMKPQEEAGVETVVRRKGEIVEERYDDCGGPVFSMSTARATGNGADDDVVKFLGAAGRGRNF